MKNYFFTAILAVFFTVSMPSCVPLGYMPVTAIPFYTSLDSIPLYRTPSTKKAPIRTLPMSTRVYVSGVSKHQDTSDPIYTETNHVEGEWYIVVIDGIRYFVLKRDLVTEGEYLTLQGKKPTYQETPDYSTPSRSSYSSPSRTIHTGPRGGQYYINSNGNKTYIKR